MYGLLKGVTHNMKISCSKLSLINGINIVSKAVSTKSTMTNLQCILIESSLSEIRLIANDIELGIETIIEGTITEAGKIALDAKLFSDIIRKLPDSEILIETNASNQANICCERSKFNVPGTSGEDFNYLPEIEKKKFISLSQFSLKEVIHQTIFSVSDQESAKIMTGELFEVSGDRLKVVSLDGHRISIRKVQLKDSYDSFKVIVPGKTLSEISKIISGGVEDEIRLYMTEKHILFEFDQTKVVSRLLEGEFYRIDHMLSDDYASIDHPLTIACEALVMGVEDDDIVASLLLHDIVERGQYIYHLLKEHISGYGFDNSALAHFLFSIGYSFH